MYKTPQSGFSLLELIAVLMIVSIVLVVSYPYFKNEDLRLNQTAEQVFAAILHARQLAMARGTADHQISLIFTRDSINILENNLPITQSGQQYPLILQEGIRMTTPGNRLNFDYQGNTQAQTVVLTEAGQSITLSINQVGYVDY